MRQRPGSSGSGSGPFLVNPSDPSDWPEGLDGPSCLYDFWSNDPDDPGPNCLLCGKDHLHGQWWISLKDALAATDDPTAGNGWCTPDHPTVILISVHGS